MVKRLVVIISLIEKEFVWENLKEIHHEGDDDKGSLYIIFFLIC